QYGTDAIDREPPYKPGERLMTALDIQPISGWQEALGMSAVLCLPVALLAGLAARFSRRARCPTLIIVTIAANILLLWLLTQLGGVALGYLVGNLSAAVVAGAMVGLLQGIVAVLMLASSRR
ncbi:MAG: hypothetical protein NZL85_01680, partial [Fimbriimonadales bacterium]|nr:hypothetical protein [Fimbriimonadales bacterium]